MEDIHHETKELKLAKRSEGNQGNEKIKTEETWKSKKEEGLLLREKKKEMP